MIIEIDNREPCIIKDYFMNSDKVYISKLKNLEQGDFIIRDPDENILLIIERKSINDLLSSVKDSRYSEQSERYLQLDLPSNKIVYIIEGNYENFSKDTIEFKTIYSCIFSLSYNKGFTLLFTENLHSTIILIEQFINRLIENKPCSKFKLNLIKKKSITVKNIDSYMLNLVPGIGITTSEDILKNFNGNLYNLISEVRINKDVLNNILIKSKKISSKVIKNIKEYLIK